ncbi:transient receptor potential cation channel subfamily A member 1 homolog [Acropora millepora]|uniref:transient receptor potential cation channel subfamily A member 1 homolog n=1 Tax=Acropora millepora TaxID=45264 RepID=UPI001CF1E7E6|nr:transient receptor potential cation channel subfamily A member 1 homolog [Acropora millepora]
MCTRTTLIEMTQVGPEPALPAQRNQDDLQVPEIEDLSHISLHQVARDGRTDIIKQKLQKFGGNNERLLEAINKGDEDGVTPLHYAVRHGHMDVVKLLSKFGADINKTEKDGVSPLHDAVTICTDTVQQSGSRYYVDGEVNTVVAPVTTTLSTDKIEGEINPSYGMQLSMEESTESFIMFLVQQGGDVNVVDNSGSSPLHYAATKGNLTAVRELLQCDGIKIDHMDEYGSTPLHCAVTCSDGKVVKALLDAGADLRAKDDEDRTPIHLACIEGNIDAVLVLLEHVKNSENLRHMDEYGSTPLHCAVTYSDAKVVKALLDAGADLRAKDHVKRTPIHLACTEGNIDVLQVLLEHVKNSENLRHVDEYGSTPLHCAVTCSDGKVVKALLDAGADLRAKDHVKRTPIHLACIEGNIDVMQVLLEHVENSENGYDISEMLEDKNGEGETALHVAVKGGCQEIVKLCLHKGAKVRARRGNSAHPLHIAAIHGHVEIAACLIEHNANFEERNALRETPLHIAAGCNKTRMVEFLLDKGADIECQDKDRYTPLLIAAFSGHPAVVELLLKRGANLKAKSKEGETAIFLASEGNSIHTLKEILQYEDAKNLLNESDRYENSPLHVAAMNGFAIIVEELLKNGAWIDPINEDQNTPLHLAAENGKNRVVTELLKHDPFSVFLQNEACNTPLHLAATEGHFKCCKALLEHGADVDERNSNQWTPLDCAAAKGHAKVADILLEYDSPVDPTDETKTTPLHLAAREGHPEVISLLLSKGADITLKDHSGRNCLDLAVDFGRKESAIIIVNDKNWKKVMRNKTRELNRVTTPMRKLIIKLPEVANVVLNHCVKDNDPNADGAGHQITLCFEFLEDIYFKWPENGDDAAPMEDTPEEDELVKELEKKENHPLMIMVENNRELLLSHPLVTSLLHYKWQKFGRYIYYFKLALFCIFLIFLTGYTIYSTQLKGVLNKRSFPYVLWIDIGPFVILALASWHIVFEVFQLFYQRKQYFSWENLLEWAVYILAIVYVVTEFDASLVNKFGTDKPTIGALSIFFSWMALVLFIRKFPKFGIYVVMFTNVLETFARIFIIYVLFIVAFGLAFYTLLDDKQPGFSSPGRSFVKAAVMMIGEFDFDDTFNSDVTVPGVTWFLFIVFVIVLTLILMNLLIGLAVDDIKGVQEQAVLQQKAMLVNLAMDVEKALPRKIREQTQLKEVKVLKPNRYGGLKGLCYGVPISAEDIKTAPKPKERPLDRTEHLLETIEGLENRIETMQFHQKKLHNMLVGVVKKLEAVVEEDDYDDNQSSIF